MTDYVISGGRSSAYPTQHYGAQFTGSRATFCLEADFSGLDANAQAIPNLPITVLSPSPVSVGQAFFGMHIKNRSNDSVSGVTFKTVRSHDMAGGKGRWQFIQPTSSTWDWVDLDAWVNTHYAAGRDLVFTLFGTPTWASARSTERNAYSDQPGDPSQYNRGIAAEPLDMTKWDAYCTAVATRYKGQIKYYEVWNEPNWHNDGTGPGANTDCYFTGAFAKLSEMVRRANQAIKAVDPTAKIICPATTVWAATSGSADSYFTGMMSASDGATGTMKDWIDIVGVHLYLPSPNRAQDLAGMIDRVNASKTTAGVSALPTWDTESAPIGGYVSGMSDVQAQAVIGRMLLTIAAKGVARTIYYQYDDSTMGFSDRPGMVTFTEYIKTLLLNGSILSVNRFTDGRVAYLTSAGLSII